MAEVMFRRETQLHKRVFLMLLAPLIQMVSLMQIELSVVKKWVDETTKPFHIRLILMGPFLSTGSWEIWWRAWRRGRISPGLVKGPHSEGQSEDRQDDLRHHLRLYPLLESLHFLWSASGRSSFWKKLEKGKEEEENEKGMTRQMEITSKLKGQNVKVGMMRTGARLRKSGWKCERQNMIGQNDLRDRWKNEWSWSSSEKKK